jgi:hypothetical protein
MPWANLKYDTNLGLGGYRVDVTEDPQGLTKVQSQQRLGLVRSATRPDCVCYYHTPLWYEANRQNVFGTRSR